MSAGTLTSLLESVSQEGKRILNYWQNNVLQPDGSFIGEITHDGTKHPDADRGVILASRILWTYSKAVSSGFDSTAEERAHRSFEYFTRNFWDSTYLGFYWMLSKNNEPVNPRKHIYAQAFSIYALSEYYAATRDVQALVLAQLTYSLIERYARDRQYGGYFESFTRDWSPDEDLRLSGADMNEAKSMNTHLHVLEAFTRLYSVWPNPDLKQAIAELLHVMKSHILNSDNTHYWLFFDADWTVKSTVISYGHDIEGSWLMLEAAECIDDKKLINEFREIAVKMVDAVLLEGLDSDYGVLNEGKGTAIIDGDKHWWPQAEAVVGCVNAYQITQNPSYLETAQRTWGFIENYLFDHKNGEWHWKVSRDRQPDVTKSVVEPWKCPYHNTRACIEVWQRLNQNNH